MKALFLDLDGTVSPVNTWEQFNLHIGISLEDDQRLFGMFASGELAYREWIGELVRIYKDNGLVSKESIVSLAKEIPLRDDAYELVRASKEKGYTLVLISGSVDTVVEVIAERLGIDTWFACSSLEYNDAEQLVDIVPQDDEVTTKRKIAEQYSTESSVDLSASYAIGDGSNDIELFKICTGIQLGNSPKLAPYREHHISSLIEAVDILE